MSLLLALTASGGTAYSLACDAGSYSITGQNATLVYVAGSGTVAYSLECEAGAYTISGQSIELVYSGQVLPDISGWIFVQKGAKKKKEKTRQELEEIKIIETAPKEKRGTITLAQMFGAVTAEQMQPVDISEKVKRIKRQKQLKEEEELMMMF